MCLPVFYPCQTPTPISFSFITILPSGNAFRNTNRTSGPATINWNGSAIIKFIGIFLIQMKKIRFHSPVCTHASAAPYNDMMITIGTTIQQETARIILIGLDTPGFTRKRNANPFAIFDTANQSQSMANKFVSAQMPFYHWDGIYNKYLFYFQQNTKIKTKKWSVIRYSSTKET